MPISSNEALTRFWQGPAAAVVCSTIYPTLFVLSQNWYALNSHQVAWLLAVAAGSGLIIYTIIEGFLRVAGYFDARRAESKRSDDNSRRAIVFGAICAGLIFFLLFRTFKSALQNVALLTLTYVGLAAIFISAFRKGLYQQVNSFLAILSVVAVFSWTISALDQSQSWLATAKQDFESAEFKRKPNVYLFIYDGYGSENLYRKVFDIDNATQYQELVARRFKVLHTFSNYRDTLQTTISVFLGAHHYYQTATGFNDTKKGRPFLAGIVHNPVLSTFKTNGYRLQYIHGLDYFVNEQGVLDYMFPPQPIASALRIFDVPLLKMKRHISKETHKQALYANIRAPASVTGQPWFTFAHVNRPSHADLSVHWRELGNFRQLYEARTAEANAHMLETIDHIRQSDPEAIIIIFGDHGSHRYNKIWAGNDPNVEFKKSDVAVETVTLDQFGIIIAVGSSGICDDYVYAGLTPVNILRTVFACLAADPSLLVKKAEDISLFRGATKDLWRATESGRTLPTWEPYSQPVREP